MCRLYAMRANEPTRVECSLVHAQNALMQQSVLDAEGIAHGHGWGVADYRQGVPLIEKQTWAAFRGEHFRKTAARIYTNTVVAHVRHATVGGLSIENTHPFHHGKWIFAHNGTIPNFPRVRDRMISRIDPVLRNDIKGDTDSEYIFYYLLSLRIHHPEQQLREIVRRGLRQIVRWTEELKPTEIIGLNVVLTDGVQLAGSRLGRTLWHLVRTRVAACDICGRKHVRHKAGQQYRAVEIASEPISDDNWKPFSDGVVFSIVDGIHFEIEPLLGEVVVKA